MGDTVDIWMGSAVHSSSLSPKIAATYPSYVAVYTSSTVDNIYFYFYSIWGSDIIKVPAGHEFLEGFVGDVGALGAVLAFGNIFCLLGKGEHDVEDLGIAALDGGWLF